MTMNQNEKVRDAYSLAGNSSFYDDMIACSSASGRAVRRLVWDMDAEESDEYLARALSGVPEGFSGRLLEVPVGTGVLTVPVFQRLPNAQITCLDYSPDMMKRAQERVERAGLTNVVFQLGDVGALPFEDESFDVVLSLHGFHVFPNKEAAYQETFRTLKRGGVFCGCFYVEGCSKRTDRFVRRLYQPLKFFTPPYETMDSLSARLESMYSQVELGNVKSMAWFVCRKE
jgi:ubiquinone/menaquinone biosynthesis C-methylase UbiE